MGRGGGPFYSEMKRLGYDEILSGSMGQYRRILQGTEPGHVIMYNGNLDLSRRRPG